MSVNRSALLLERLGALIQQAVRDDAAQHGLLPVHLQVLSYLDQANRYSDMPIAIAEYLGLTRGTVSQSLALLEREGLVDKHTDESHGRRVHMQLTAAGKNVVSNAWSRRSDLTVDTTGDSPGDDGGSLESVLIALVVSLQKHNGQRAFGVCRTCSHFQTLGNKFQCGLTGERLQSIETGKLCREFSGV